LGGIEAFLKVLLKCEADVQQQQQQQQQQRKLQQSSSTSASSSALTQNLRSRMAAALMSALDGNAGAAQAVVDIATSGAAAVPALMVAGGASNSLALVNVSSIGGTPLKGTPIKGMNSANLVGIGTGAPASSVGVATLVVTADTDDRLTATRAVGALRHLLDALAAAAGRGLGPGRFAEAVPQAGEEEWGQVLNVGAEEASVASALAAAAISREQGVTVLVALLDTRRWGDRVRAMLL
jgi:hypothetical protein